MWIMFIYIDESGELLLHIDYGKRQSTDICHWKSVGQKEKKKLKLTLSSV